MEDVEFDITDNHIIQTINKTLLDKDEFKQLFGLDLIKTMPLDPWKSTLVELFQSGSINVKKAVLEIAGNQSMIIDDQLIIDAARHSTEITSEAIAVAGKRKLLPVSDELHQNLSSPDLEIRSASACSLLKMHTHEHDAKTVLQNLLNSKDVHNIRAGLQFLDRPMGIMKDEELINFLHHSSHEIREESLRIAAKRDNPELIDHIIGNLAYPKTAMQARLALGGFEEDLVLHNLDKLLFKEDSEFPIRMGIIRCLKQYQVENSLNILQKGLNENYLIILREVTNSLISVSRGYPASTEFIKEIELNLDHIAQRVYQLVLFLNCLPEDDNCFLIRDHISSDIKKLIRIMLKLGVLHDPKTPIETYIQYVANQDPELMPYVLELVDTTFSQANRKLTMPLIDIDIDEVIAGKEFFDELLVEFDDLILFWIHGAHKWKTAIGLNYIIKSNRQDLLEKIDWDKIQNTIFIDQLFSRIEDKSGKIKEMIPSKMFNIKKETDMYSILEKTILLKSVDLFKNIPGDVLTRIAQISEETFHSEEKLMFSEGDYGDSMYIVVDGNVRIHKGEHHIVTLGKSTVLGEMALLDQEPRSADATAEAETTVLKIEQDGFYELMAGNSEIMQQIIKMLSGRLRDTNIKLQEALG